MSTQQTPDRNADREYPDHEPPVGTRAHADLKSHSGKTPRNKKNWDKRTRRRHSVATGAFAVGKKSNEVFDSDVDSAREDEQAETPEQQQDQQQPQDQNQEQEQQRPQDQDQDKNQGQEQTPSSDPEADSTQESPVVANVDAEPEAESTADHPRESQAPQDIAPEPAPQERQRARSLDELVSTFDDDFYDSLDISGNSDTISDSAESSDAERVREIDIVTAESNDSGQTGELDIVAEVDSIASEERQAEEAIAEPDSKASAAKLGALVAAAELETEASAAELDALFAATELDAPTAPVPQSAPQSTSKSIHDKPAARSTSRSWKARRHAQDRSKTKEPTPAETPAGTKAQAKAPRKQPKSDHASTRKQPSAETQSTPRKQSAHEPTLGKQPAPEPTPRKQRPRQKYLQSPTLKQAFRNLFKLNGGAAWRATCWPIVIFFLLFGLLSLAVVDAFPAVDTFNATINAAIHSLRGTLDAPIIILTTIGDFLPMAGLCLVVCLVLALAKRWDSLAFFATNVVLAIICIQALKLIFAVPRPGDETLVPIPGSFSFPSAHSFCSLIVLGMLGLLIFRALYRRNVSRNAAMIPGIILVIFALLIGISRIYVGVHWPSDVLGGWLLAGLWLSFAGALYTVGARQPSSSGPKRKDLR